VNFTSFFGERILRIGYGLTELRSGVFRGLLVGVPATCTCITACTHGTHNVLCLGLLLVPVAIIQGVYQ